MNKDRHISVSAVKRQLKAANVHGRITVKNRYWAAALKQTKTLWTRYYTRANQNLTFLDKEDVFLCPKSAN